MTRTPSAISKLKKLADQRPGIEDIFEHVSYTQKAEDRAIAIIEASQLENTLEEAITTKMVDLNADDYRELFKGEAPLSSFGTKIKLGFALGLFGKHTRKDLEAIRWIRNTFAHCRTAIFFDTAEVSDVCDLLTAASRTPNLKDFPGVNVPLNTPRKKFLASTRLIDGAFLRIHWPELLGRPSESAPLD